MKPLKKQMGGLKEEQRKLLCRQDDDNSVTWRYFIREITIVYITRIKENKAKIEILEDDEVEGQLIGEYV